MKEKRFKRKEQRSLSVFIRILFSISFCFFLFALLSISLFALPANATAGINKQINFQGKLVDANGLNVANGTYSIIFSLYSVSSAGTAIWTETDSVVISNGDGIFQVPLGVNTTLPGSVDFNTDNLYLGIKISTETNEMTPRVRFTAVPYAFNAEKVAGLTVTNTTGTLTIPNAKTISFADAFTTSGAFATTLTSTAATNVTLPTTGTLATLAGAETLTNKTIGSTGLVFSGATTDVDTASGEGLVLQGRAASSFLTTAGNITFQPAGTGTIANVQIGAGGAGSTTPDFLGLDVKSDTGDPAGGFEGALYYNTFDNKFRCFQGSAWTDCIGTGGGGSSVWSALTAPTAALTMNMFQSVGTSFATTFTYGNATSTTNLFNLTDTASNSGTGNLLNLATATSSTLKPLRVAAAGVEALSVNASGNVGIGLTNPATKLDVMGLGLDGSQADGTVGSLNTSSTLSVASGTHTYSGVQFKPTINTTGGTTTFNVLNIDTTNTATTGTTTNLIKASFGGTQKFAVASNGQTTIGNLTNNNGVLFTNASGVVSQTATGGAGSLCLVSTAGGTPSFGACSGTAATAWSSLTAPTTNLALTMGENTTAFNGVSGTTAATAVDSFTFDYKVDATSDLGAQRVVVIRNNAATATVNAGSQLDRLLVLDNASVGKVVPVAMEFTNSNAVTPGTITTGIQFTGTGFTQAIDVGANKIKGTTGLIDYTNFDVAANGNITVAVAQGLDTNAAGTLALGDTTATTLSIGTTAATTLNFGAGGSLARAINIGTGTGVDTINIGTGATGADVIAIGSANAGNVTVRSNAVLSLTGSTNSLIDFPNFDVATTGNVTVAAGQGIDTNASGILNLGNTTATTVNIGGVAPAIAIGPGGATATSVSIAGGSAATGCTVDGATGNLTCSGAVTSTATTGQQGWWTRTGASLAPSNGGDAITTTGNISTTSGGTISSAGLFTASAGIVLSSGASSTFTQTYTGTTTDAHAITANSLTTAAALKTTSTNNSAANTAWSANQFNVTNSQATTGVSTGSIAGLDLQFTQNAAVAGNETAARIALAATSSSPVDNVVDSILSLENNDTATGNLITATDGLRINATTANNITHGIEFVGTFGTNLIKAPNFVLTNAGAITTGTWSGSAIAVTKGGTGVTTFGGTNTILFTTATDTLSSITTGNNGALVTSGTGVPSITTATANQVLRSAAGGAVSFGSIDLSQSATVGSSILGIANGGTGSSAQNFVDLTTTQTAAGAKTWSNLGTFSAGVVLTSGVSSTFTQAYTGTTTDAHAITANLLTTAAALKTTSTNNSAANTAWSANQFNVTNSQATTAVSTGSIAGLDVQFTQSPTIAGNTETVGRFALALNSGSPTDSTVASILSLENNDTITGNQIVATDALKIVAGTASNITNGINLSGTFATNLITSTNFTVTQAGALTAAASLTSPIHTGAGAVTLSSGAGAALTLDSASNTLIIDATDTTLQASGVTTLKLAPGASIIPNSAGALTFGNASTTAINLTTDGTGDGELVLPGTSVGNAELVNSSLTVAAGSGLINGGSVSLGGTTTLNIGAGNGITVNADDIAVNVGTTGTTANTFANSGLEVSSSGLKLLGGCSDTQILKWNGTTVRWECNTDVSGGSPSWNTLGNPVANQALSMGQFTTAWTYNGTTGSGTNMFSVIDSASNTGTGYISSFSTAASSNAKPFRVVARGNTIIDTTAAGGLTIGNVTAAQPVDINSGTGYTINGTTGIHSLKGGAAADITTLSTAAGTGLTIAPSAPTSSGSGTDLALNGGLALTTGGGGAVNITGGTGVGTNQNGGTVSVNPGVLTGSGTSTLNLGSSNTTALNLGTSAVAKTITIGETGSTVQTIRIGQGTGANVLTIGNVQTGGSISLGAGLATGTITVGGTAQTGLTILGQSTKTNEIDIGNGNTENGLTQTIKIGAGTPAGTGLTAITVGNSSNASALTLNAGAGGLTINASSWTLGSATNVTLANSTAALKFDSASNTLVIDSTNHRVAIGQTAPTNALTVTGSIEITGTTGTLRRNNINGVDTATCGAATFVTAVAATGGIFTGTTCGASDRRLKKDIISEGGDVLSKIHQLNPVTYEFNDTYFNLLPSSPDRGRMQHGLIAQEVEKIFPELVIDNTNGFKGVGYSGLISVLTKGVQELDLKVDRNNHIITDKADGLRYDIEDLKTRISRAETDINGLKVQNSSAQADTAKINNIQAFSGSDVALNLTADGKFIVKDPTDSSGQVAITFDSKGNGTFKGTLSADKLQVNTISSATQDSIAIQLSSGESLVITTEAGEDAVRIDEKGNAFFKGTITADKIKANQIEGLEIFVKSIKGITSTTSTTSADLALSQDLGKDTKEATSSSRETRDTLGTRGTLAIDGLTINGSATVSADLRVKGNGLVEGILNVIDTLTAKNLIVSQIADFFGNVVFHNDVTFAEHTTFNKDTAGEVVITKDSDKIEVKFEKEYASAPIINATLVSDKLTSEKFDQLKGEGMCDSSADIIVCQERMDQMLLDEDNKFIITSRSSKGFVIVLKKKANIDMKFSWNALSVTKEGGENK